MFYSFVKSQSFNVAFKTRYAVFINGLVRVQNLISIYMEYVMLEVDFYLSLGPVRMV